MKKTHKTFGVVIGMEINLQESHREKQKKWEKYHQFHAE